SKDDAPNDTFMIPRKEINMVTDMGKWKQSQAYADYMGFVLSLNKVVKGKKLTCEYKVSETVQKLLQLLGTLEQWIIETPPVDQPSRFDHPTLEPRHFIDAKVVNEHHQDYMFLDCIKFINEMKTGPFAEHSNQLWNISAVHSWSKVNQGLIKMYRAECLEKFPVIQHFKFGSLLSIQPVK
ncbi:unnamed protein product, partial [Tetraodon nigroviridis]